MKIIEMIKKELSTLSSRSRATISQRFFKTGKGQYGEGDVFIGVSVPDIRILAKRYFQDISLKELLALLRSKIHEERLLALIMMVYQFQKATKVDDEKMRKALFDVYLKNTKHINNWDLVDSSAEHIVGRFLCKKCGNKRRDVALPCLYNLAKSNYLWERRIAILATFHYIKHRDYKETLRLAKRLLRDEHDLIHKAVGWMLREMGKHGGHAPLHTFLTAHARTMPCTMLRYAIERLPPKTRQYFLR